MCNSSLSLKSWELMVQLQSEVWQAQDPGRAYVSMQVCRQDQSHCSSEAVGQEEFSVIRGRVRFLFHSDLHLIGQGPPHQGVCFTLSTDSVGKAHHIKQSALPCPLIQMLISSRNALTEIPSTIFDQMSGHPVAQSGLDIQLNITPPRILYPAMHSWLFMPLFRCSCP